MGETSYVRWSLRVSRDNRRVLIRKSRLLVVVPRISIARQPSVRVVHRCRERIGKLRIQDETAQGGVARRAIEYSGITGGAHQITDRPTRWLDAFQECEPLPITVRLSPQRRPLLRVVPPGKVDDLVCRHEVSCHRSWR